MNQTILVIRIVLMGFCIMGGYAVWWLFPTASTPWLSMTIAALIGALLILVDILLRGFSLRGLSGLTFGLLMGLLASHFITISPLFDGGDAQVIYVSRVVVFIGVTYLATVIALRGKDEFNLVIPYVRFEPQKVEAPLVVVDESSLIDGRVSKLCQARLIGDVLFVPKFVIEDLNVLSGSEVEEEKNRGKRGLRTLEELRKLEHVEVRVFESDLGRNQSSEDKLLFVVSSLKGRLLTSRESMARRAKVEGVPFIDLLGLSKALTQEVVVGEAVSVKLVKEGKEHGQGVGYLDDGSMVVVNGAADLIGTQVLIEVDSIIPTSGGRMIFGKLLGEADR